MIIRYREEFLKDRRITARIIIIRNCRIFI